MCLLKGEVTSFDKSDRTSVGVVMMWQSHNPNATNKFTDVAPAVWRSLLCGGLGIPEEEWKAPAGW